MDNNYQETKVEEIDAYIQTHPIRKLHLGAATSLLDGWLNTDILPVSGKSIYLNATKLFPIADNTFDYIFSEHMIEHIGYEEGLFMQYEGRMVCVLISGYSIEKDFRQPARPCLKNGS